MLPVSTDPKPVCEITIRVLATTDLHMHLLGSDGPEKPPAPTGGLAGIASLIETARAEAEAAGAPCLLFDNGDTLQGTPLAETLAEAPVTPDHALVQSFNALKYDACGLGNHDLDFGLPYLFDVARHLSMPVIASNLEANGPSPLVNRHMLEVPLRQPLPGGGENLRIGIFSVLPETTAMWNADALEDRARVVPVLAAAERAAGVLRREGADLIIALAHMGPDRGDKPSPLKDLTCADAIIAGHTHLRCASEAGVPSDTTPPRPMVMPGFAGSDLGVLDLQLRVGETGTVELVAHESALRRNGPGAPQSPRIQAICATAIRDTARKLEEPVAHLDHGLHSYFALARPTGTTALIARAQERAVRLALAGTPHAELPVVSVAADPCTGGRGGPWDYVHIRPGIVRRRDLAALCPYRNQVWAVRTTGAELRRMMNHTARIFTQLSLQAPDQPINDPAYPGFEFDTFYGLTCTIDPTRPSDRVQEVRWNGSPLRDDAPFVLATNQFRAAGGGGRHPARAENILLRNVALVREAVEETLNTEGYDPARYPTPWRFACPVPIRACLHTSPDAGRYLSDELSGAIFEGETQSGFAKVRLSL